MDHVAYLSKRKLVERLAKHYYNDGTSLVPDHVYDRMLRELEEFEAKHPEVDASNSPTKRVGSKVVQGTTSKHNRPMYSLKNALTLEELRDQVKIWLDDLGVPVVRLIAEPKYDGCAGRLSYVAGSLIEAATRGDGHEGEDITANALLAKIPYEIDNKHSGEVRGEFMINRDDLDEINRMMPNGDSHYSNTRNAIAGILRRKKLAKEMASFIRFYPYEEVGFLQTYASRDEKIRLLESIFPVQKVYHIETTSDNIYDVVERFRSVIPELPFEVDGLVIKLADGDQCAQLGERSNSPRWAIAYKYPPEEVESVILSVIWQVGRTGEVAPVSRIAPVVVGGVIVTGPTMHNLDVIEANDWRVGDTVKVYRAGAVIPALGSVLKDKRPTSSKPIEAPSNCPCCNSPLEREGPSLFCRNEHCIDQLVYKYDYIFSRKVLDVANISDKTIRAILEKFTITSASDFFTLSAEELATLPGYTLHSGRQLYDAFAAAQREQPLAKVIQALCIPDVGESTSKQLALALRYIEVFFVITDEELLGVKDVGKTTVANIRNCLSDNVWLSKAKRFVSLFSTIKSPEVAEVVMKEGLTDMNIVITGSFPETREEMQRKLQIFGAKVRSSVTKKTNYVIAGSEPSVGKMSDAEKNKVRILDYEGFLSLIK